MVRLIFIYFTICLFFSSLSFADSLNKEEKIYFNFLDLNNDNHVSYEEIDKALKLIFILIDKNNDKIISKEEIIELKNIILSLS